MENGHAGAVPSRISQAEKKALQPLEVQQLNLHDPSIDSEWSKKKLVWVPHPEEGFLAGKIIKETKMSSGENTYVVELVDTSQHMEVSASQIEKMNPPKLAKSEDMSVLSCLNEAAVLHNLKERYYSGLIYTYSGLFCVVINPYKKLPIYTDTIIDAYKGKKRHEVPPHIFAIADSSYRSMMTEGADQSILCTGESGAGKTENTKKVIQYLAHIASSKSKSTSSSYTLNENPHVGELEQQLLQANPILEAFGNAKTVKNDNSSRFGKFIRINFDASGYISGANIATYLLEKSRVIHQSRDERSFHIFHQFLLGATEAQRQEFLLNDISRYRFITEGNVIIPGVDDSMEFRNTIEAMKIMGMADDEIASIFRVISAILHFGDMEFIEERNQDQAQLKEHSVAQKIAYLIGVKSDNLVQAILKPKVKMAREMVTRSQNVNQAKFAVEAIAKACYEKLFAWLVARINKSLDKSHRSGAHFIGILDIAGFEIFERNSFEQLCINYTNEKLQQLFNHTMFILEQEEYQREQISWEFIDFGMDLQPTIDLIEQPVGGIMAILNEECWFPKATDHSFVEKLSDNCRGNPKFQALPLHKHKADFVVHHYAEAVPYSVQHWLVKNQDPLNENLVENLKKSSDPFVFSLWKDAHIVGMAATLGSETHYGVRVRKGMFNTVCQLYKEQLNMLMLTLENTNPNFVRCIIPNLKKKAGKIDSVMVLQQLRCNGVLEGIRICRQGFPSRIAFQEFRQRYEILTPNVVPKGFMDGKEAVKRMVAALDLSDTLYRIGKSKIFFRAGIISSLEEERDMKLSDLVTALQAACRGVLARRAFTKRVQQLNAIRIIQRNCAAHLKLRNWEWWRLFTKVQPLLTTTKKEGLLIQVQEELKEKSERLSMIAEKYEETDRRLSQLNEEKNVLETRYEEEKETISTLEESQKRLTLQNAELENMLSDVSKGLEEESVRVSKANEEKKHFEQRLLDVEAQLEEEENNKQKVLLDKVAVEGKLKKAEEELSVHTDQLMKVKKEVSILEARLGDSASKLATEEGKVTSLNKAKQRLDNQLTELDEKLKREQNTKNEVERAKRQLEKDIMDLRENLNEKSLKVDDLQVQLGKREEELTRALTQCDEEGAEKQGLQKMLRDLTHQKTELEEDLQAEKKTRLKIEKVKNDLTEELDALKQELEHEMDTTAAQNAVQLNREKELTNMRSQMESEQNSFKSTLTELRTKHSAEVTELNDQLQDKERRLLSAKKELKNVQAENVDLSNDLANERSSRSDNDKRRKQLENLVAELQAKLTETERQRTEYMERLDKKQKELDSVSQRLQEVETQFSQISKSSVLNLTHLEEQKAMVEEETAQKLALQVKNRQLEADKEKINELLEEEVSAKELLGRQYKDALDQIAQLKANVQANSTDVSKSEELRKRLEKDLQESQLIQAEHVSQIDKLEKSRKKLQAENEDVMLELQTQRNNSVSFEKKQRKFDSLLQEERLKSEQYVQERDKAQQETREQQTQILSMQREIQELKVNATDSERIIKALKADLESAVNLKDEDGKKWTELKNGMRKLEEENLRLQDELENAESDMQIADDKSTRLQCALDAAETRHRRELGARDEGAEEQRRGLQTQLRDLELDLENEKKLRSNAVAAKKKFEMDLVELQARKEDLQHQVDDSIKADKKMRKNISELLREVDDLRADRERLKAVNGEIEKRSKQLESENATLQDDIERTSKYRRLADADKDELQEEVARLTGNLRVSNEKNYMLESRLNELDEELNEIQDEQAILSSERNRYQEETLRLQEEVAGEKGKVQNFEAQVQSLERHLKEARLQLSEVEVQAKNRAKILSQSLEDRIRKLDNELINEQREHKQVRSSFKRLERSAKSSMEMVETLKIELNQQKDMADKAQSKLRSVKQEKESISDDLAKARSECRNLNRENEDVKEELERVKLDNRGLQAKLQVSRGRTLGTPLGLFGRQSGSSQGLAMGDIENSSINMSGSSSMVDEESINGDDRTTNNGLNNSNIE